MGCGRSHGHSSVSRRLHVAALRGHACPLSIDGDLVITRTKLSDALEYQDILTPARQGDTASDVLGERNVSASTEPLICLAAMTRRVVAGQVADALAQDGLVLPVSAALPAGWRGEDRGVCVSIYSRLDLPFRCTILDTHRLCPPL